MIFALWLACSSPRMDELEARVTAVEAENDALQHELAITRRGAPMTLVYEFAGPAR